MSDWEHVGNISVDAGLVMVGDPCYHAAEERPEAFGEDWQEFVDKNCRDKNFYENGHLQLNHDMGHEGLGVLVSSGYGDGVYPVFVKKDEDGTVTALKVEFVQEEVEDYED